MLKKIVFLLGVSLLFFSSCSQEEVVVSSKPEKKAARVAVDGSDYKDATSRDVNATLITRGDFASMVSGTYWNGDSYMSFDFSRGRAVFYCPSVSKTDYKGKSFKADFVYDVKAAGRNLLYLCPLTKNGVNVEVSGEKIASTKALPFCLFVPVYGFGGGRIEVSSVMDGEIVMPSGTYWKKK